MKTIQNWIDLLEELKQFLQTLVPVKAETLTPLSKYIAVLDDGHGGIDPDGVYTTNGKFWTHEKGTFHKGSTFMEGVFNRIIVREHLVPLLKAARIEYELVAHEYIDTPLAERTRKANEINKKKKSFLISFHSNAANTKARGWSVFTSPGQTTSDVIADKALEEVKKLQKRFGFSIREDMQDGDGDWEAKFWMLVQTNSPAILLECLFFDNYEDAMILMDKEFQAAYAKAVFNVIVYTMNNIEL